MKYSILVNQVGIARDKELLENTDLIDWAIIDYLFDWLKVSGAQVFTDNAGRRFVWCSYDHLIAQMPLLKLSKSALSRRLTKMRKLGLIITKKIDRRIFVYVTSRAVDVRIHTEHPSTITEDTNGPSVSKNNASDAIGDQESAASLHQRNDIVAPAQRSSISITRESKYMHSKAESTTSGGNAKKVDSVYMPDHQKDDGQAHIPKRTKSVKNKSFAYVTRPLVDDGYVNVETTNKRAHFMALAEVCKIDVRGATVNQRRQLGQSSKILRERLEATPEQIRNFARWWYKNDWRGQRGQPPKPAQVRECWGRYMDETAGGKAVGVVRIGR